MDTIVVEPPFLITVRIMVYGIHRPRELIIESHDGCIIYTLWNDESEAPLYRRTWIDHGNFNDWTRTYNYVHVDAGSWTAVTISREVEWGEYQDRFTTIRTFRLRGTSVMPHLTSMESRH